MSVTVDQAKTAIEDAAAVVDRLESLPLGYTEKEILSAVRGVLSALDAALAVVAEHEQRLAAAASAAKVSEVTAALSAPAVAPDGGSAA